MSASRLSPSRRSSLAWWSFSWRSRAPAGAVGRAHRGGLLAAAAAFAVLSLGFETSGLGRFLLPGAVRAGAGLVERPRPDAPTPVHDPRAGPAGRRRRGERCLHGCIGGVGCRRSPAFCWSSAVLAEGAGFRPGRWYLTSGRAGPAPAGLAGLS